MCDLVTGPLQTPAHMHAGTNAAYVERISNIPSMGQPDATADAETVVNTEWGAFSCAAIPRCAADAALDAASVRPGAQPFEKLVSGMYLPEIVRRCGATRHAGACARRAALCFLSPCGASAPHPFSVTPPRMHCVRCGCSPRRAGV